MSETEKRSMARYIKRECMEHADEWMFGKLPGARYKSQYYMSRLLYNKVWLATICDAFHDIVSERIGHWDFQITGREWSSIPLLTAIPMRLADYGIDLNSFMIKRERKTYGIHNYVEGIPNDLPVLIVDDLCNSTNSFLHCYHVCKSEEMGLDVLPFIFAVLDKSQYHPEDESVRFDKYLGENYEALTLLTGNDIRNA